MSTDMPRVKLQILPRCRCHERTRRCWYRDLLGYPLMRTMPVVVPGVATKNPFEMPCVDDEEMIQALGSDSPHESLGIGIGVWRPERSLEDLGTF